MSLILRAAQQIFISDFILQAYFIKAGGALHTHIPRFICTIVRHRFLRLAENPSVIRIYIPATSAHWFPGSATCYCPPDASLLQPSHAHFELGWHPRYVHEPDSDLNTRFTIPIIRMRGMRFIEHPLNMHKLPRDRFPCLRKIDPYSDTKIMLQLVDCEGEYLSFASWTRRHQRGQMNVTI